MYTSYGTSGYGPGSLSLDIYNGSSWTFGLWSNTSSDSEWQTATIDLSAYAGLPYVILSFTGETWGWQSDIAMDDLTIEDGQVAPPFIVDVYPYNEGFDTEPVTTSSCCPVNTLISKGWQN